VAKIILVRHGETVWNKEERIQGQQDVPLSPTGLDQAKRLQKRFESLRISAAYSSDLERSFQTAKIALPGRKVRIETYVELRERYYGSWEKRLWTDIVRDQPQDATRYLNDDSVNFTPPEGEPWLKMQDRIYRVMLSLIERHRNESIAVFTHGGPIKALIVKVFEMRTEFWRRLSIHNASLTGLDVTHDVWILKSFNDICHLTPKEKSLDTFQDPEKRELIG